MTTRLNDQDPSISYVGPWKQAGTSAEYYKGTTTYANVKGATANLTFSGKVLHFFSAVDQ